MKHTLSLALVLVAGLLFASSGQARVLRVPSAIPTIPAAIDSAAAGDTILVAPGTYYVNLDTGGKWLVILSEAGKEGTILDGNRTGSVVVLDGGGVLEGFTIQNGWAEHYGGGVFATDYGHAPAGGRIEDCDIQHNQAGTYDDGGGGGVFSDLGFGLLIRGCKIADNYAGVFGGGVTTARGSVIDCEVLRNGCHVSGGGIDGCYDIKDSLIAGNWCDWYGAGICNPGREVINNTIVGNHNTGYGVQVNGIYGGAGTIEKNVIAFNVNHLLGDSGIGVAVSLQDCVFRCNDIYGHPDGDLDCGVGCDTTGTNNLSADPLFCDPENGDYRIRGDSPCRAAVGDGCGLIGAFEIGCLSTPVERTTWGSLKSRYGSSR